MSVINRLRYGAASALIAVAGLAFTAPGPAAQAAARAPAAATPAGLHTSGKAVKLGAATSVYIVAEAPDGRVYYAIGDKVYSVSGTSAPALAVGLTAPVLAIAATNAFVFVQTGLTVFEYGKDGGYVTQWALSSPQTPVTSAGLLVSGSTVWSWTDWATDTSGFQYATVSTFSTSSHAVKVISTSNVFPGDWAADSAGLYYELTTPSFTKAYLVLTAPSGTTTHKVSTIIDAPVALSSGQVDLLAAHSNGKLYVDSFRASNLTTLAAKAVPAGARNIAGTTAGLLLLDCQTVSCSKASVGVLNPATGKVSGSVSVPHTYMLLAGPAPAVLTDVGGKAYLVRLS